MIIPMPAEYLDQLYTEIGLLFLISLFLLILFLCTVIRFHTKKRLSVNMTRKFVNSMNNCRLLPLNAISFVQKLMIIRTKFAKWILRSRNTRINSNFRTSNARNILIAIP